VENLLASIQLGAHVVGLILFVGVLPRSVLDIFQEENRKSLFVCWLILIGIILLIIYNLTPIVAFLLRGQPATKPVFDAVELIVQSVVAIGLGICARLLYRYDGRPITQVVREIIFK
jgi:hypothetical protein